MTGRPLACRHTLELRSQAVFRPIPLPALTGILLRAAQKMIQALEESLRVSWDTRKVEPVDGIVRFEARGEARRGLLRLGMANLAGEACWIEQGESATGIAVVFSGDLSLSRTALVLMRLRCADVPDFLQQRLDAIVARFALDMTIEE